MQVYTLTPLIEMCASAGQCLGAKTTFPKDPSIIIPSEMLRWDTVQLCPQAVSLHTRRSSEAFIE